MRRKLIAFIPALILLFVPCLYPHSGCLSKDLGTYGQTFTIAEPDLLEEIGARLKHMEANGQLQAHQYHSAEVTRKRVQRPQPVFGVTKAKTSRVFLVDPTLTVSQDLKDHQGRVFHKKGERINPLDQMSLNQNLFFIDGDDQAQQDWIEQEKTTSTKPCKVILVNGSPFALMEKWQHAVYFDQGGSLCKKFGIHHVPARVEQQGKSLQVSEIALDHEEGAIK